MLREEFSRVPIANSNMYSEERRELQRLASTFDEAAATRFNYCYRFLRSLEDLTGGIHPDGAVLIHDFGWASEQSKPEITTLTGSYGATAFHGVCFSSIFDAAERYGAECWCTSNDGGDSQFLLVRRAGFGPDTANTFLRSFESTGQNRVRDAITRAEEIADEETRYPEELSRIVNSLAEEDRDDHGMLVRMAWELIRRGFPKEAIVLAKRSLDGYAPVAVYSHLLLGIAYHKTGDLDSAERHLNQALSICPLYSMANAELSRVYLARGQQLEHLSCALESLRCPPSEFYWEQVVVVAIALLIQGRTNEAKSAIGSILDIAKQHPTLVPASTRGKLRDLLEPLQSPLQGD